MSEDCHASPEPRFSATEVERRRAQLDERARHWLPWPAVAETLVGWRRGMGWSQGDAASALGVGLTAYNAWERGRAPITRRVVLACWALQCIKRGVE